jgi:acetone carboxylase gamma subunit
MKNTIPIENEPSYSKDLISGALLNTDTNKLMEYKSRSKVSKNIKVLQDEINILKKELETIKTFLKIS